MSSITNFFKRRNNSNDTPQFSNKVPKNNVPSESKNYDPAVPVPSTSLSTDAVRTVDCDALTAGPPEAWASTKLLTTMVKTVKKWEKELRLAIQIRDGPQRRNSSDQSVVQSV